MPRALEYNAVLVGRRDLGPELAVFHARHDEPWGEADRPAFVAGQYVAIGLRDEAAPGHGGTRRSMSIASAPEERDRLEFYVRLVREPTSEHPLTPLLWQRPVGSPISVTRRAVGKLTLPATVGDPPGRLVVMVAAGTGLAPFVSIVRSARLRDPDVDLGRYVVLHGASYPRDLGYRDELRAYAEQNGLHYLPTVSRAAEVPEWSGDAGRVEDFFLDERLGDLEARIGLGPGELTPERAGVLVCGLEGTIRTTLARLLARGFVPEQRKVRRTLGLDDALPPSLWWEQYDASPVVDPEDVELVEALRERFDRASRRGRGGAGIGSA